MVLKSLARRHHHRGDGLQAAQFRFACTQLSKLFLFSVFQTNVFESTAGLLVFADRATHNRQVWPLSQWENLTEKWVRFK